MGLVGEKSLVVCLIACVYLQCAVAATYTTLLGIAADSACPLSTDSTWNSGSGTPGAIVDPPNGAGGSTNLLYAFGYSSPGYLGSFPGDALQCQALCQAWPGFPNAPAGTYNLVPYNGQSGPCSYWSHDGLQARYSGRTPSNTPTCYLFSSGACKGTAFSTGVKATYPNYRSGGGPGQGGSGVKGDPHFTGAYNSHFDFTGVPNESYCIVSDAHLHINFFHGGRFSTSDETPKKALTWIRQVGILWGHHTIKLAVREGASWQYEDGYMSQIQVDGQDIKLSQAGDVAEFSDAELAVRWVSAKKASGDDLVDVYQVEISNILLMELTLRPEVAELRTQDDAAVHFDITLPVLRITRSAHGVLGQTYRSDRKDRLANLELEYNDHLKVHEVIGENGGGYLDGTVESYRSTGVLKSDCLVTRFARTASIDSETAEALEMSSGFAATTVPDRLIDGAGHRAASRSGQFGGESRKMLHRKQVAEM